MIYSRKPQNIIVLTLTILVLFQIALCGKNKGLSKQKEQEEKGLIQTDSNLFATENDVYQVLSTLSDTSDSLTKARDNSNTQKIIANIQNLKDNNKQIFTIANTIASGKFKDAKIATYVQNILKNLESVQDTFRNMLGVTLKYQNKGANIETYSDLEFTLFDNLRTFSDYIVYKGTNQDAGYKRIFMDSCSQGKTNAALEQLFTLVKEQDENCLGSFLVDLIKSFYSGNPKAGDYTGNQDKLAFLYGYLVTLQTASIISDSLYNILADNNAQSLSIIINKFYEKLSNLFDRTLQYLQKCIVEMTINMNNDLGQIIRIQRIYWTQETLLNVFFDLVSTTYTWFDWQVIVFKQTGEHYEICTGNCMLIKNVLGQFNIMVAWLNLGTQPQFSDWSKVDIGKVTDSLSDVKSLGTTDSKQIKEKASKLIQSFTLTKQSTSDIGSNIWFDKYKDQLTGIIVMRKQTDPITKSEFGLRSHTWTGNENVVTIWAVQKQ